MYMARVTAGLKWLPEIEPKDVQKLDSTEHIRELQRVGQAVFERKVRPEHFKLFIG